MRLWCDEGQTLPGSLAADPAGRGVPAAHHHRHLPAVAAGDRAGAAAVRIPAESDHDGVHGGLCGIDAGLRATGRPLRPATGADRWYGALSGGHHRLCPGRFGWHADCRPAFAGAGGLLRHGGGPRHRAGPLRKGRAGLVPELDVIRHGAVAGGGATHWQCHRCGTGLALGVRGAGGGGRVRAAGIVYGGAGDEAGAARTGSSCRRRWA